jgi:transaldolase
MNLFANTADTAESLASSGFFDSVTTNPSLVVKTGKKFTDIIREIRAIVPGRISTEVPATGDDGMMREAAVPREIAKNVTIKLPLPSDGPFLADWPRTGQTIRLR